MSEELVRVAADIPAPLHAALRIFCFEHKMKVRDAIAESIAEWVKSRSKLEEVAR